MVNKIVTLKKEEHKDYDGFIGYFYKNGVKSNLIPCPQEMLTVPQLNKFNWFGEVNIKITNNQFEYWFNGVDY